MPESAPNRPASASVAGPEVTISNADRVIFPESGQTKGDLAAYYRAVAPLMLPFAAARPISLVRCPEGRARKCFFQKHDTGGFGNCVLRVPILEKDGDAKDYFYIKDAVGILQCVQMGTIEFHGWQARTSDVEKPDRLVFDLDPDEGLDFGDVKRAALEIRARLAERGLAGFPMLTGGKGVHVVVPLTRGHDWDAHKEFARRFAEALAAAEPDRFTAAMSKARRKGKIFVDWMRNQRGATAVVPFSARARVGAPVAMPIGWGEIGDFDTAHPLSIDDADQLLQRAKSTKLAGWSVVSQSLPDI